MERIEFNRKALGHTIHAEITLLDKGINVLLVGGERPHVGAVSYALPKSKPITMELPTHKEACVSEKWANALANAINEPTCVECGIHYDNATKIQISIILEQCEELLQEVTASLRRKCK